MIDLNTITKEEFVNELILSNDVADFYNPREQKLLSLDFDFEEMKKETRGGTRQGSGAKPKYNEQTKTVAFRCPLSKVDELKLIVKSKLSEWSVK